MCNRKAYLSVLLDENCIASLERLEYKLEYKLGVQIGERLEYKFTIREGT